MSGRHRVVIVLCAAIGLVALVALLQPNVNRRPHGNPQDPRVQVDPKTGEHYVIVKGVRRHVHDLSQSEQSRNSSKEPPYGRAKPVPRDANRMVQSVAEALETGEYPERLSALIAPKDFDPKVYKADPDKYLNAVEPGRVFQTAQPGPGVEPLKMESRRYVEAQQGETVSLKVRSEPKAPVTFTSFDSGQFHNQLPSVTVSADDEGVAIARFTGTSGTYNLVHILAGSPLSSGRASFVVNVKVAGEGAETAGK